MDIVPGDRLEVTVAAIARHGSVYLIASGGAACLVSEDIRTTRVVACRGARHGHI